VSLGAKCSEGPAVSRSRLHIAWTQVDVQYPEELPEGVSRIVEADIVYENGTPRLGELRPVLDDRDLPFPCTLEVQNFVPPGERTLTFSTYGYQGGEAFTIDLATMKVVNHTKTPDLYEEPEGVFPDGQSTLIETDRQRPGGWRNIDLWRMSLDGTGAVERLTFFNDVDGYKASNGVISDDGRFLAFQLARSIDDAGVGYGIFVMNLAAAGK
jgi:Tol biopolymer transport system component